MSENWTAQNETDLTKACVLDADRMHIVAHVYGQDKQTRAIRTRIIAAAPVMLFLLKELFSELPSKRDWLNPNTERLMKEVINSAEGKL